MTTHRALAIACLGLVLIACRPALPRAPTSPDPGDDAFAVVARVAPAGVAPEPAPAFTLISGDVVAVHVEAAEPHDWPELLVDGDGAVRLPLAGAVLVAGATLADAEARLTAAVQRYELRAIATLRVVTAAGHRASVIGAVTRAGVVTVAPGMRLSELVAASGGLPLGTETGVAIEIADADAAQLVRAGEALPVSLALALRGDPRHDVWVHAGDVLYVPPARGQRISVLGAVTHPGTVRFEAGLRLTEAIASVGGTSRTGDLGDVRVVRGPLSAPRVYRAALDALFAGRARDVELAPGDVVYVGETRFGAVMDVVQRIVPLLALGAGVAALAR